MISQTDRLLLFALWLANSAGAQPLPQNTLAPVRIILVGDSTVADKNGWGPGFCTLLIPQATCVKASPVVPQISRQSFR